MKKQILSLALSLSLISSIAFASDNLSLEDKAQKLVKLNIMSGYEDGSLKLENNITRAEFTTLTIKSLGKLEEAKKFENENFFKDAKKHWAKNFVNYAKQTSLISGYSDGSFKPDNNISYSEILTILIRALGYDSELNEELSWPENYIQKSIEIELIKDVKIDDFSKNATRGDVAALVYNSLFIKLKKDY